MTSKSKTILLILGAVSALLLASQFILGMLILQGGSAAIRKSHQHSGYLTAAVAMIYIGASLTAILSTPNRTEDRR